MTLGSRDKRALALLGAAVVLVLLFRAFSSDPSAPPAVAGNGKADDIKTLELRLRSLRQSMARVPGKQDVLKQVSAELATREKGLFDAATVNEAQAQVLDLSKKVARKEGFDFRGSDFSAPKPFGDAYGEVMVTLNAECTMEQLVNFLADLANERQFLSTTDLRIAPANVKHKTVTLRVTVSGLVPRRLVPEKKA